MGFYVNPDNRKFKEDISSQIYVDKTMLLALLNSRICTRDKFLCVSRPRRFGKTMAERMMAAYYSKGCDSARLFSGFKIASDPSFANHLNKYNVIHLDANRFWSQYGERAVGMMAKAVRDDFAESFPEIRFKKTWDIADCMMEAYKKTLIPFVVIFDEYDVFFRDEKASDGIVKGYLDMLNVLFKSDDVSSCIALAYLTGILPIIREKAQSKLNNFKEITFLDPGRFTPFTGFTEEEVKALCEEHSMNFDECRSWYDGYSIKGVEIYAPRSVVYAMEDGEYKPFWNQTSQYGAILDPIMLDIDGMKSDIEAMITGNSIPINTTSFLNTPSKFGCKDDVFTYLCHLGYLAYDSVSQTCSIPNREVRGEWINALSASGDYALLLKSVEASKSVLESVWSCDAKAVADALSSMHERVTSIISYNDEACFQSVMRLAFFYADCYYTIISECPSGKGYADLVFIPYKPNIPALVIELKVRGTSETALEQIRDKRYFAGLDKYVGNMLLVGISYDKDTKKHDCVIEKA